MAVGCVLGYNLEGDTLRKLRGILAVQKLRFRAVSREEYGVPLGRLAGGRFELSPVPGDVPGPMLVFCSLPESALDRLLAGMRRAGVRVDLKAVLTPTNAGWDSVTLYRELERERQALQSGSVKNNAPDS